MSFFDWKESGREIGYILINGDREFGGKVFNRIHWRMLKCSGCGRGGLAKFHDDGSLRGAALDTFHPRSLRRTALPPLTPNGVANEYREAELCASVTAWRGASALLRSALEKLTNLWHAVSQLAVVRARNHRCRGPA